MARPSVMLDMDMGTGKTRVAIDVIRTRQDVRRVLVLCPKAVIDVWPRELEKHAPDLNCFVWACNAKDTVKEKTNSLLKTLKCDAHNKQIIILNYDAVWRPPMGETVRRLGLDMIVADESHRVKSAGSKVSKFMAMLGRSVKYKMCLSGTPMANSPLDVYGQYRFLDPTIYGTDHSRFLDEYAIMSYTSPPFIIGCKNQKKLHEKFRSIAYSCKLSDVQDRVKLPPELPRNIVHVQIPKKDMVTSSSLGKDFMAECAPGQFIVLKNVLNKMLRLQQITSGFCVTQPAPLAPRSLLELNTSKQDALSELLAGVSPQEKIVIFYVFTHDAQSIKNACDAPLSKRDTFELSGRINEIEKWRSSEGGVLAVQIQAGAEGLDMTCSHVCVYYSLPYSLALYSQSQARLRRPGQKNGVLFSYLVCDKTVDQLIYDSLVNKRDLIEDIKSGSVDFRYLKSTAQGQKTN